MLEDVSQWASSSYVLCALTIDCVITLTIALFSFTGPLEAALFPRQLPFLKTISMTVLDLFILVLMRCFQVAVDLIMPNACCTAAHMVTFGLNTITAIYGIFKFCLLFIYKEPGALYIEHQGVVVSVLIVALAHFFAGFMSWLEWVMTVRYRQTLIRIINRASDSRMSDVTASEYMQQRLRTPLVTWERSEVRAPLLSSDGFTEPDLGSKAPSIQLIGAQSTSSGGQGHAEASSDVGSSAWHTAVNGSVERL